MKVYKMLPGHGLKDGKRYSFLGRNGLRDGQRVVAPYRHWKSGKIHKTMWTIMQGDDADSPAGTEEIDKLGDMKTAAGRDVQLRRIEGTDIIGGLPGGKKYGQIAQDRGLADRQAKALWTLDSTVKSMQSQGFDSRSREKARDLILRLNPRQDNTEAAKRILGD